MRVGTVTDHTLLSGTQKVIFNLPCGVVVASTSAEGEIQHVNPAFTAITGYTHEDVPTVRDWLLRAYPDPDYRAMVSDNWEQDTTSASLASQHPDDGHHEVLPSGVSAGAIRNCSPQPPSTGRRCNC